MTKAKELSTRQRGYKFTHTSGKEYIYTKLKQGCRELLGGSYQKIYQSLFVYNVDFYIEKEYKIEVIDINELYKSKA